MSEAREISLDARETKPAMRLRLRLIGTMEACTDNGTNVLPIGRKSRALLAILGVSAPHAVSRGRLAYLLWSRRPPEHARASLRQELHRLLAALQPAGPGVLSITRETLSLQPDLVWIDVEEASRATVGEPASLNLLAGELLSEFDSIDPALDQWLTIERKRLRDRSRTVAEALLDEQAEPDRVILAARQLLCIDGSHEGAWRALLHGYAVRGESGKATQTYEQFREVFDELRASPSPTTQQLAADIRAGVRTAPDANEASDRRQAGARWGARIGVMALRQLSGGDAEAEISASLMESVTTALMKFRGLVLQPLAAIALTSEPIPNPAKSAFGPDFMLHGSVQRISERLRVSLWLIDVHDDECVAWINRWERGFEEVLACQDEIAGTAAAEIDIEALRAQSRRIAQGGLSETGGYDLVVRALALIGRLRRDDADQAGHMLARVRELQPDNPMSYLWSAYLTLIAVAQGWSERSPHLSAVAGDDADRAVNLDPQDARALSIAGHVRAFLHRRPREALALHDRALSLNPNLPLAWELSGTAHVYLGEFDEAARHFHRCKRLLPTGVDGLFCEAGMVAAALLQRRFNDAVTIGQRATQLQPSFAEGLKPYLAALGHVHQVEQSRTVLSRLLAIEPCFSLTAFLSTHSFERDVDRDLFADGLRLAGVPESALHGDLADGRAEPSLSKVEMVSAHGVSPF